VQIVMAHYAVQRNTLLLGEASAAYARAIRWIH
jgi:hypothetical protein